MKKPIVFIVLKGYADQEGNYAAYALSKDDESDHTVKTASFSADPISSASGYVTYPDFSIDSVPSEYAGVVLLGAPGWTSDCSKAHEIEPLVRDCCERGLLLGGIGSGVSFLAATGVLNDARHTGNSLEDLQASGGKQYSGELYCADAGAVRDGNLVTARSTSPLAFAGALLSAVHDPANVHGLEWYEKGNNTKHHLLRSA